ncbi:MAG: hypothetical protein NWQ16_05970 [Akkermansiaceae bacterium]|nr:hypothetical protein [Akkermansiaceae bacterium]
MNKNLSVSGGSGRGEIFGAKLLRVMAAQSWKMCHIAYPLLHLVVI